MNRNLFTDPILGTIYSWPTNHTTEEPVHKTRQMGDGAPTSNVGLNPQQGADGPIVFIWKGKMFLDAEVAAIMHWWHLCSTQTILATDFTGAQYELIITDFDPQRVPCVANPRIRDGSPNTYYTWDYTMTMRIIRAYSGIWAVFDPLSTS